MGKDTIAICVKANGMLSKFIAIDCYKEVRGLLLDRKPDFNKLSSFLNKAHFGTFDVSSDNFAYINGMNAFYERAMNYFCDSSMECRHGWSPSKYTRNANERYALYKDDSFTLFDRYWLMQDGFDPPSVKELLSLIANNPSEDSATKKVENDPSGDIPVPRSADESAIVYAEVPRPAGNGSCSDNDCPCGFPGESIPPGAGYLWITDTFVDFRKDCPSLSQAAAKLERMEKELGAVIVQSRAGGFNPVLICERGAKARGLDLSIARADAKEWWATGKVPLRPTPQGAESRIAANRKNDSKSIADLGTNQGQSPCPNQKQSVQPKKWWQFWK